MSPTRLTTVQVVDFGGGEVVIYTGTASGALCRLRLNIPSAPGAQPDQIQVGGWKGLLPGISKPLTCATTELLT